MNNLIAKTQKFLREVKIEMNKVTWPSWVELKGSTLLVIVVSIFFAVYIGIIDLVMSFVTRIF